MDVLVDLVCGITCGLSSLVSLLISCLWILSLRMCCLWTFGLWVLALWVCGMSLLEGPVGMNGQRRSIYMSNEVGGSRMAAYFTKHSVPYNIYTKL